MSSTDVCCLPFHRSGSSSESGSDDGGGSAGDAGSRSGSRTPEPQVTPLPGEIPVEEGQRNTKGKDVQTYAGIFGADEDFSSSDEEGKAAAHPQRGTHEEVDFGDMSDDGGVGEVRVEEEEEEEPVVEEAPRIDVDIPRCVAHLGTDIHFVKLPNILSMETRSVSMSSLP